MSDYLHLGRTYRVRMAPDADACHVSVSVRVPSWHPWRADAEADGWHTEHVEVDARGPAACAIIHGKALVEQVQAHRNQAAVAVSIGHIPCVCGRRSLWAHDRDGITCGRAAVLCAADVLEKGATEQPPLRLREVDVRAALIGHLADGGSADDVARAIDMLGAGWSLRELAVEASRARAGEA